MTEELVIALAVVFVTAGVLSLIANQFGLSPIPFYIIAGLIAGRFVTESEIIVLAQWGIAFLVFAFAIRIDFADVETVLRDAELASATQLIVVAPIAFGVGYLFGDLFGFADPVRNAVYFSAAVVLSSSLVGGVLLGSEIRENLVHGRLASSIHFFDDLVAIALLLILSTEVVTADAIAAQIGYGVVLVISGLVLYRHGFPLLVRLADGDGELVLVGSISILIAFLAAAEYVGVSIVVGAFAAGVAIRSDGTQALEVQNGISSITDFFVAIFFVTVGALVAIPSLEVLVIAATLSALVLALNPLVHVLSFIYEGYDARTAFLAGSSLNQVSEFALIIAIQALLMGTIADPLFDAIILAAAVTMLLTFLGRRTEDVVYETVVARLFRGQRTRKVDERSSVDELEDHVLVVGYGRIGRRIVETLEDNDVPYVVLENDPVLWDELDAECRNYVLGDALAEYPWEKAQVGDAALVCSTVDHRPVSETILELETDADADVLLRSESAAVASDLLEAGATQVAVPNVLAGEQLLATVDALAAGETDPETLEREQRDYFQALERYGFATRDERV